MMHKKNFIAAIKVDGKVLRESSERVQLPFGSEYSVLLKNLDTVRMQAQISIDGQDASGWLVLAPGESLNVERFYKNNRDSGHRFKFIERTDRIEQHRGIQVEDGLVRVEFKREKVYEATRITEHHTYHHYDHYVRPWYRYDYYPYYITCNAGGVAGSLISASGANVSNTGSISNLTESTKRSSGIQGSSVGRGISANLMRSAEPTQIGNFENEAGITVNGSISNQRFIPVAGFECEASEVIVLHLVGRTGNKTVEVAKTVEQKPVCSTCGRKNKPSSNFCIECGTNLQKV